MLPAGILRPDQPALGKFLRKNVRKSRFLLFETVHLECHQQPLRSFTLKGGLLIRGGEKQEREGREEREEEGMGMEVVWSWTITMLETD